MDISELNTTIEWRGISICPMDEADGDNPLLVQVRFNYPEEVKREMWQQLNSLLEQMPDLSYRFLVTKETDDSLTGLLLTTEWLSNRVEQWIGLERYVTFLIIHQEEETRITDDLACSYPIIQQEPIFIEGVRDVSTVLEHLQLLHSRLTHDSMVIPKQDAVNLMSTAFQTRGFSDMMRYIIRTIPAYTGSSLEAIGEPLWKEWQELLKKGMS